MDAIRRLFGAQEKYTIGRDEIIVLTEEISEILDEMINAFPDPESISPLRTEIFNQVFGKILRTKQQYNSRAEVLDAAKWDIDRAINDIGKGMDPGFSKWSLGTLTPHMGPYYDYDIEIAKRSLIRSGTDPEVAERIARGIRGRGTETQPQGWKSVKDWIELEGATDDEACDILRAMEDGNFYTSVWDRARSKQIRIMMGESRDTDPALYEILHPPIEFISSLGPEYDRKRAWRDIHTLTEKWERFLLSYRGQQMEKAPVRHIDYMHPGFTRKFGERSEASLEGAKEDFFVKDITGIIKKLKKIWRIYPRRKE